MPLSPPSLSNWFLQCKSNISSGFQPALSRSIRVFFSSDVKRGATHDLGPQVTSTRFLSLMDPCTCLPSLLTWILHHVAFDSESVQPCYYCWKRCNRNLQNFNEDEKHN